MGILDNLENAWDGNFDSDQDLDLFKTDKPEFESKPMLVTDNMGREIFWEDMGRPNNDSLALKIFKEQCCDQCQCEDTGPWKD